ncbi:MAG: hypothetical protein WBM78_20985, partial [Desulfobacterales bacterium]
PLNLRLRYCMLRYYDCFFNSFGCAIDLVFFSISGKNTDQNQDPSSLEAVPTPSVINGSLKNCVTKTTDQ